jgi:uncharacterized protein with HEPN domain
MLVHAEEAAILLRGMREATFRKRKVVQWATVRLLEVIGEAANRIPREVQQRHPAIPWSKIVGLRNRLAHGYDAVDLAIVWRIARHELPGLAAQVRAVLSRDRL